MSTFSYGTEETLSIFAVDIVSWHEQSDEDTAGEKAKMYFLSFAEMPEIFEHLIRTRLAKEFSFSIKHVEKLFEVDGVYLPLSEEMAEKECIA